MKPPADQHPVPNPLPAAAVPRVAAGAHWIESASEADQPGLKGNVNILVNSRWLIGAVTLLVTALAFLYALAATPVYQANLLIHVEVESANTSKNILSQVSSLFGTKQAAIAEMELVRSRMVIAQAVDRLQLYVEVAPKRFPIIGSWLAARRGNALPAPGIVGLGGFAWGAELAEVAQFEVPAAWENREFVLTAIGGGRFRLSGGDQPRVFEGKVGAALTWPAAGGNLALRIEHLHGKAGARFHLRRLSRLATIDSIRSALSATEQGMESGMIEVTLTGDNAHRINSVLGEIGRAYIRQNRARKTEDAEKALAFLEQQLPELKVRLVQSEERYKRFRNSHGSIDMGEEARLSLEQAAAAERRSRELQQKRIELLVRYNEEHPLVRGLDRKSEQARAEIAAMERHIKALPTIEQDEARLKRELQINTDIYTALKDTAQKLRLVAVGGVSNVRLIDAPVAPERPIKPNRPVIVALAVIIGLFLGMVIAFTRRAVNGAIDDPRTIELMLGARVVYASIPHSKTEQRLSGKKTRERALLAEAAPYDLAVESLRSFRTALLCAMPRFRNNIVMITGPSRGTGTSFVSANLAAVLAAGGQRVLLIDADLRHGRLQRYFGLARAPGLSDAIAGAGNAIHTSVMPNLDVVATGVAPPNRSALLLHPRFGTWLAAVSAGYDVVLLDPPPVLGVADALTLGAHAGAVFMLARAGRTSEQEIKESLMRLNHAGIAPQGVLFNGMMVPRASMRGALGGEPDAQMAPTQ